MEREWNGERETEREREGEREIGKREKAFVIDLFDCRM